MARLLLDATDTPRAAKAKSKQRRNRGLQQIERQFQTPFDTVKVIAMRTFRITLPCLLLATTLVGCASIGPSASRTPFTQVDGDFPDTRIASIVTQDGIVARGEGTSGGVLDTLRAKLGKKPKDNRNEAIVTPLRDALAGVDVRAELARELDVYGRKGLPFPITEVESRSQPISDPASRLQVLDEGALLLLNTEYFFTPDYSALRVETTATLTAKRTPVDGQAKKKEKKEVRQSAKPVYANEIIVHWEVPLESRDDPLSYWLADGGKNVQNALVQALRESARLLVWDLNDPNGTRGGKTKAQSFTIADPKGEGSTRVKGILVMETLKRYIIRLKSGELLSVPNPKPESTSRRNPNA